MRVYNSYVNFICDLIIMDIPMINYHYKGEYYNSFKNKIEPFKLKDSAKSTTIPEKNEIYIDLDKFDNEIDVFIALTHELRHCGQYQAIMSDEMDDLAEPEVLNQWKAELTSYKASDVEGYENQSVEMDANAFTWLVCRVVFGIELQVNCDQDLFHSYKEYILGLYSIKEIKECLKYSDFEISKNQA